MRSPDRSKFIALGRALRDRDDDLAEVLATELAPFIDEICDAMDRDPKAITPQWGLLA